MKRKPEAICTVSIIVINVAVFLILSIFGDTEDAGFMMEHGAMYKPLVIGGRQYYRLFTCLFLHFGISHLANNMILLGALGWNLELEIGKIRFIIIYFISGLAGNLVSLYRNVPIQEQYVSAGASGAIFGLMGALFYAVIANKGRLGRLSGRGMLIMIALSLYYGLTSSGVDNYAHIGGLVCGVVLSAVLYRPKKSYRQSYGENSSGFSGR